MEASAMILVLPPAMTKSGIVTKGNVWFDCCAYFAYIVMVVAML
eukprot:CAMPEP_0119563932 /NCGR_PEP_ID=MMETSP1352-20130426/25290_1 /TAXON_ID=265584 /ORGANISM="Stauroneis constricta, Strain CCMP1120" /LENGTH=43 /DNA_ID= /DNA_START= /DNA_END= /DNA_ORIENTATION=